MIPIKIQGKHLCEIFEPTVDISGCSEDYIRTYSTEMCMYPTEVFLTSETYSRDAERTADYELENLTIVNRKAKPEFTWKLIRADYVKKLMRFLGYHYDFKNGEDIVIAESAPEIEISYYDFIGERTIVTYLGQTIDGTLVEYGDVLYWENFRIAFPER